MTIKRYRETGYRVPAKSRREIRASAQYLRDFIANEYGFAGDAVDVTRLIEHWGCLRASGELDHPDFQIVEDSKLPGRDAEFRPRYNVLQRVYADDDAHCFLIRESVWDAAVAGDPAARETLGHEVGHCAMEHPPPTHGRTYQDEIVHRESDSEWQANVFLDEFLMDSRLITLRDDSWVAICDRFNVTPESAIRRLRELMNER